ncbi:MAG: NADH-quinone oxidoreductase subunit NuoE [Rhodospirillaceae bacterium]
MSTPAKAAIVQPEFFAFTEENLAQAYVIMGRYPADKKRSAVLPLLHIAQRQHGNWLPRAAMDYVAGILEMPPIRVYEVATFYTMYNLAPVGKHLIEVCTMTPCWLRGSDDVLAACKKRLGIGPGETTADGQFTVVEVECAGACVNAPVAAIGDHYYEDLDAASMTALIDLLEKGETPTPGSQIGRQNSCPAGGPTTLTTRIKLLSGTDQVAGCDN